MAAIVVARANMSTQQAVDDSTYLAKVPPPEALEADMELGTLLLGQVCTALFVERSITI